MRWSDTSLLAAWAVLACQPGDGSRTEGVIDDAGRPLRVAMQPQRVVSLSPATTELLFTLGAGDRVVGRTRWCQDPPTAARVPSVGDGLNPNIEAVLSRRPDLVVFYHSAANGAAIRRLEDLGIATVSVRLDRLGDLARAARLLGRLTGDSGRADSLVEALDAARAQVAARRRVDRPSVLLLAWDSPPIVIGGGSFLSEIVELAGGRNAFGDLDGPSATVSVETIAARNPDVVFVAAGSDTSFAQRPEWQVVEAVRERRFAVVQGTEFEHPSFRAPAAIQQLRALLMERGR